MRIRAYLYASLVVLLLYIPAQAENDNRDYEFESTTTYIIEEESNGSYSLTEKTSFFFKFLSQKSTEDDEFNIHQGSFDEVSNIKAYYNDDRISSDNISYAYAEDEDVFISDYIIHTISLPHKPAVGDRVFYEYKRSYKSLEFIPMIWVANYQSLKSYKVVFQHPASVYVDFEKFFPAGEIPYSITRPSATETVFAVANLSERKTIPFFAFNSMQAVFLPNIKNATQALTPLKPQEFCNWYLKYFTFDMTLPESKLEQLSQKVNAASSQREKIGLIYDYVRQNTRYIAEEEALGSIVPRPPATVLERGYGDCKDKAFLIATIAQKFHLPVNMALVSTYHEPDFKGLIHRNLFNHAICAAEIDGSVMFMDPTCKECEFGNLPDSDIGGQSLIVSATNARFVPVVPAPKQGQSLDIHIKASLDDLKNASATITLRNNYYWAAIHNKTELTESQLRSYLARIVTEDFQKISLDSFSVVKDNNNEMVISAHADLSSFVISSTEKKYIPQVPFRMIDNDIIEREKDTLPMFFRLRNHIHLVLDIDLKGMTAKPSSLSYRCADMDYLSSSFSPTTGGRATLDCEMRKSGKFYSGEHKKQLIEYAKQFLSARKAMNILTK